MKYRSDQRRTERRTRTTSVKVDRRTDVERRQQQIEEPVGDPLPEELARHGRDRYDRRGRRKAGG